MVSYNELLYDKVSDELRNFLNELEKLLPKEIISHSYEKVFKEDIVMCFESIELDDSDAKALYKMDNPLDFIYGEWLHCDRSYMDMLRDTIDDCCDMAVQEMGSKSRGDR